MTRNDLTFMLMWATVNHEEHKSFEEVFHMIGANLDEQMQYYDASCEEVIDSYLRNYDHWTCKICGKLEVARRWIDSAANSMKEQQLCFHCHHWWEQHQLDLNERGDYRWAVVNGSHYVLEEPTDSYFKGFGGADFVFLFNDGSVRHCNNVWYQGDITKAHPHWREVMPDNARIFHLTKDEMVAAEYFALKNIDIEDVEYLLKRDVCDLPKEFFDFSEAYGKAFDESMKKLAEGK